MAKLPPGCHPYLPRTEINAAMRQYLGTDGWYLLRPSLSNPGQYSICVSYRGDVKNFKINMDAGGQFSVSSKKFNSLEELLFAYSKNPFRSKKGGTEIYLLYPIPVDKQLEQHHIQIFNQSVNAEQQQQQFNSGPPGGPRLPPRPGGGGGGGGGSRGPPVLNSNGRSGISQQQSFRGNGTAGAGAPPLPSRVGGGGGGPGYGGRPLPTAPGGGGGGGYPQQAGGEQPPLLGRRMTQPGVQSQQLDVRSRPRGSSTSGELAPGWTEYFSEEHGRPYYHHTSGKTVWVKPLANIAPAPSPQPQRGERARPLPNVPPGGGPPQQQQQPPQRESGPPVPHRAGGYDLDAPPLPGRSSSGGAPSVSRRQTGIDAPPPVSRRQAPQPAPQPASGRGPAPGVPQEDAAPPPAPGRSRRAAAPAVPGQRDTAPPVPDQRGGAPPPVGGRAPPAARPSGRGDLPPSPSTFDQGLPPPASRQDMGAPLSNLPPSMPRAQAPPVPAPAAPEPAAPAPAPAPAPAAPTPPPAPPAAPAPPPPPPAGGSGPAAPAAPSLSGIGAALQAGKTNLKKAEPVEASGGDGRGDLLSSIRGGMKLKKVDMSSEPKSAAPDGGPGGMMASMRGAIDKIRQAVEDSDEGDDFDEVEDDDDW